MTSDLDRPCPLWCQQPAGHLRVRPAGPGDSHTATITTIDLPNVPGLRDASSITVGVEQYVTSTQAYAPKILLGIDHDDPDGLLLTPEEATRLADALHSALGTVPSATPASAPADDAAE
jgi:hypothetical protein